MDEFELVDEHQPLDIDAHINRAPEGWMVRAFFHQYLADLADKRRLDPWRVPAVPPGSDLPLRDCLRTDVAFARLFEPNKPIRGALRKLGWFRLPAMMSSPASRILLKLTPLAPLLLLKAVPQASKLSGSTSTIRVIEASAGRCVYDVERYHGFRDVLIGAIDAALEVSRVAGVVRICARDELTFRLSVEWDARGARPVLGRYGPDGEVRSH